MIKPTTAPEVIRNALEYLDTLGWTQDEYQNKRGQVCALGALQLGAVNDGITDFDASERILDEDEDRYNLFVEAKDAIGQYLHSIGKSRFIHIYNDREGITVENVKDAFRGGLDVLGVTDNAEVGEG